MQKQEGIWLGVAIACVVALAAFFVFAPKSSPTSYAPQDIGGSLLYISSGSTLDALHFDATLAKPGFITIHQAVGPAPGPIAGVSSLIEAGTYEDFAVPVSSLTPSGGYVALLFVDNGDGVFVSGEDMPVSSEGRVVRVDFKAPAAAAEEAAP